MEEIRDVVDTVVRGCAKGGVQVPEVLAAFVARTVIAKESTTFVLDAPLTPESTREIILQSIERLLERDNPSLETMKMQVEYDTSFIKEEQLAQNSIKLRNKLIASHKLSIVDLQMSDANDFETLTTLYRKIFRFLLDFVSPAKGEDKVLEREVAAALESVFPRIGLKAFVQLTFEEKSTQLMELARIILGIRLFNKDQGRGGAGLTNMDTETFSTVNDLNTEINGEVEAFADACNRYQTAVINANRLTRKRQMEEAKRAEMDEDAKTAVSSTLGFGGYSEEKVVVRWSDELTNRRQYLGFLRTLQDEMQVHHLKITQLHANIKGELANIKKLVSEKNSVAKEVIYPRFDSLGTSWLALYEESFYLTARATTFQALNKYRLSFHPSLTESRFAELASVDQVDFKAEEKGISDSDPFSEGKAAPETASSEAGAKDSSLLAAESKQPSDKAIAAGVSILSIEASPEFMHLPLELQGYCPWTLVHGQGLLVPGKPNLGVVRWDNLHFVCDHKVAVADVAANPQYYVDKVKEKCRLRPEYIHLLRMQSYFPAQAIARMLDNPDFDPSAAGGKPSTMDASTETPTHFVERRIDINYHWNEWELRRRALQAANLRKCTTIAQQTDKSHFKRDSTSQVFLPKDGDTQTRKERGTNPPVKTSYIQGLRGTHPEREGVARVVQLTTDF